MENFAIKYTVSAIAANIAEICTYPLDMIKTRLQIQGQKGDLNHKTKYRGMMKTAVGIVKEEGFFRLWHGVPPALYRHFIYSGVRMTTYEYIREGLEKNADGSLDLWKSVISGVLAGSLGQYLANPMDIVKVQIQMEGRRKLEGLPPRVHNTWHAVTKIVSEGGIRGLWKGWAPNVQRGALVNLGDLTTYDTSKHFFLNHTSLKDDYFTHIISSGCSGLIAALLGTPADTIKTRIMNQPTNSNGQGLLYKNSVDCMMKTIREEGLLALYKGFIPCWTRMAPWSLTFWLSYEQLRKVTGVTSF